MNTNTCSCIFSKTLTVLFVAAVYECLVRVLSASMRELKLGVYYVPQHCGYFIYDKVIVRDILKASYNDTFSSNFISKKMLRQRQ